MRPSRVKTIRAVEPNAGTQRAFEKKLQAFSRSLTRKVFAELVADLREAGFISTTGAEDALPRLTARENAIFERVSEGLAQGIHPEDLREKLTALSAKKISRWLIDADAEAKKVSWWFCRSAARDVTQAQMRVLEDAGVSREWLKGKFDIPLLRGQYVTPEAAKRLPGILEQCTGLITKMAAQDLERLQNTLAEGLASGRNIATIQRTLISAAGFDAARAKRVALDQTIKINQELQAANARSIGIEEAIWKHVPGQYSSRETHRAMDGQRFPLDVGIYDPDVGRPVRCGELPYCRCIPQMILPADLLKTS